MNRNKCWSMSGMGGTSDVANLEQEQRHDVSQACCKGDQIILSFIICIYNLLVVCSDFPQSLH